MKIWHVLHGFPKETSGGTERVVEAIARAMQAEGHEVTVVCGSIEPASSARVDGLSWPERQADEVESGASLRVLRMHRDDLHYEDWHAAHSDKLSAQFAARLQALKPDVVHVHHWLRLSSDLVRLAKACGAVTAVTTHDYYTACAVPTRRFDDAMPPRLDEPPASPRLQDLDRAQREFVEFRSGFAKELAAADLRYAPSAAHAAGMQEALGVSVGDFQVARPPLLRRLRRVSREPEAPAGHKLLVWGSLYPEKGIDLALDAVFSVGGPWTLEIRGEAHDPVYRDRLATRVAAMPNVTLTGPFEPQDLESTDADFALLPSRCAESYGLTLDEARDLGLPVIAADLPAYREHADPAATQFFEAGDAGDLARILAMESERLAALARPEPVAAWSALDAAGALCSDYSQCFRRRAGARD